MAAPSNGSALAALWLMGVPAHLRHRVCHCLMSICLKVDTKNTGSATPPLVVSHSPPALYGKKITCFFHSIYVRCTPVFSTHFPSNLIMLQQSRGDPIHSHQACQSSKLLTRAQIHTGGWPYLLLFLECLNDYHSTREAISHWRLHLFIWSHFFLLKQQIAAGIVFSPGKKLNNVWFVWILICRKLPKAPNYPAVIGGFNAHHWENEKKVK